LESFKANRKHGVPPTAEEKIRDIPNFGAYHGKQLLLRLSTIQIIVMLTNEENCLKKNFLSHDRGNYRIGVL